MIKPKWRPSHYTFISFVVLKQTNNIRFLYKCKSLSMFFKYQNDVIYGSLRKKCLYHYKCLLMNYFWVIGIVRSILYHCLDVILGICFYGFSRKKNISFELCFYLSFQTQFVYLLSVSSTNTKLKGQCYSLACNPMKKGKLTI